MTENRTDTSIAFNVLLVTHRANTQLVNSAPCIILSSELTPVFSGREHDVGIPNVAKLLVKNYSWPPQ